MTDDILDDPDFQEWAKDVRENMLPKLEGSPLTVSIVPKGPADVKYAVELGFSIMLNKPIILAVPPGTTVPEKLVKVADEIIEIDLKDSRGSAKRMGEAMSRVAKRLGLD